MTPYPQNLQINARSLQSVTKWSRVAHDGQLLLLHGTKRAVFSDFSLSIPRVIILFYICSAFPFFVSPTVHSVFPLLIFPTRILLTKPLGLTAWSLGI